MWPLLVKAAIAAKTLGKAVAKRPLNRVRQLGRGAQDVFRDRQFPTAADTDTATDDIVDTMLGAHGQESPARPANLPPNVYNTQSDPRGTPMTLPLNGQPSTAMGADVTRATNYPRTERLPSTSTTPITTASLADQLVNQDRIEGFAINPAFNAPRVERQPWRPIVIEDVDDDALPLGLRERRWRPGGSTFRY